MALALLSMRARTKIWEIIATAVLVSSSFLLQLTILNHFSIRGVICNLPLTIVITWGLVFGSSFSPITPEELRMSSAQRIFLRQILSGSISGGLVGAFIGSLYASVVFVYPVCFIIIGWISGYFCLRNITRNNLLCIPLVLILTCLAEPIMAWQLWLTKRPEVFEHLIQVLFPEALLNALMAPFIYFPLRHWHDFSHEHESLAKS